VPRNIAIARHAVGIPFGEGRHLLDDFLAAAAPPAQLRQLRRLLRHREARHSSLT